jgi:hypothetical protein
MTRILFVGQKMETVDFFDPPCRPASIPTKSTQGIAPGLAKIEARVWQ